MLELIRVFGPDQLECHSCTKGSDNEGKKKFWSVQGKPPYAAVKTVFVDLKSFVFVRIKLESQT